MENNPKFFDNITSKLIDDLRVKILPESKISIAAASFSIYAYQALRAEFDKIKELRFLFTGDTFTKEQTPKEKKEFYIPRASRERSLYGNNFELKLRNELSQKAVAKECADWIRAKVSFKANKSGANMSPFMTVENATRQNADGQNPAGQTGQFAYTPFNNFSTADLGQNSGNDAYFTTTRISAPASKHFFETFETVWQDKEKLDEVTQTVLENITAAYQENPPELIYFVALYNIFSEFLEEINEDFLPNEKTGFKQSQIWQKLYNFQKDAVVGCISKLEKHNGCILADSVGLGKTFSALGVIKYYESRNKTVLVLCPKRLADNWNTFKSNYKNNPIAQDRLRYDVLYHTDILRDFGCSNGIDLALINWQNYDLVVIDESHNFRNGGELLTDDDGNVKENRYHRLLNKIIKQGVKTKVLMLSATPVNIDFTDLKNQLMLACEGDADNLSKTINAKTPVNKIFNQAQKAFKEWSKFEPQDRTAQNLLSMLSFDFFELLDGVTIARSRKHIETYYQTDDIGKFPERLKPVSLSPDLTDLQHIDFNGIYGQIQKLNLLVYTPMVYVHASKRDKYIDPSRQSAASWGNRELGRLYLMDTNLLKRLESSVYAFRLTLQRIQALIADIMEEINNFEQNRSAGQIVAQGINSADLDGDEENAGFTVGKDFKIDLADMDYKTWRQKLQEDQSVLANLIAGISKIAPERDLKLRQLISCISQKTDNPINAGNKKILIFSAFADTAEYLYENLKDAPGLNFAMVSGGAKQDKTTLKDIKNEFNDILTCFSPKSKNAAALFAGRQYPGDIDILIATDCISEGQNLQDCDYLINYDIHWNPVRIIQRFGRIDRIGSQNAKIQLVNFWPNITLDEYIRLKERIKNRMDIVGIATTGGNILDNTDADLQYRKNQLQKLKTEAVDLEEMRSGINIMDLGLNEFHLDLQNLLKKYGHYDNLPLGIHAVAQAQGSLPAGVIFVLKNRNPDINIDKQNRLHPFYLVYIKENGELQTAYTNPRELLDNLRLLCQNQTEPVKPLIEQFNKETNDGKNMQKYSALLGQAIKSMISVKEQKDIDSLFTAGGTTALENKIKGLDDFELIDFLAVRRC
jgi:SNF2 family DNA or RNA helicase